MLKRFLDNILTVLTLTSKTNKQTSIRIDSALPLACMAPMEQAHWCVLMMSLLTEIVVYRPIFCSHSSDSTKLVDVESEHTTNATENVLKANKSNILL